MSDGDFLAEMNLIDKTSFVGGYHLTDLVMRQEVVALALRLLNVYIPVNYTCR